MYESPQSLQNICLDVLSEHIAAVTDDEEDDVNSKFLFQNLNVYLHREVSEQLLHVLSKKKYLNDKTLSLFDPSHTRLEKVKINNASQITQKGLKILRLHKITDLEVTDLDSEITVNELIGCLGEWTLQNIKNLNVRNNSFTTHSKFCVVVSLSKLRNLKTLNVSNTEFNGHGLEIVAEDLPCLENLDISETRVKDISPLQLCKHRLKSLNLYNLKLINGSEFVPLICSMELLRHLDISNDKDHPFHMFKSGFFNASSLLKNYKALPNLISLDLSGKEKIDAEDLRIFLEYHPNLRFLGLCEADVCFEDMFINKSHCLYNPDLFVTGCATETQVLRCLEVYAARPNYLQKCLYYLYGYTQLYSYLWPRLDVFKLLLPVLEHYPNVLGIQLAGTACLYSLTRSPRGQRVSLVLLRRVVEITLAAMENFPTHQQLHKNALLTLCSDRILQDVQFDRFHCTKLVMESLVAFEDQVMNKLSVAICSILAARISTKEASSLGLLYMKRLLGIVEAKVRERDLDILLKFTLSALWNLTDESPETCRVFLDFGGLNLFLRILKDFPQEFTVGTKVLGLINNIAEVTDLRPVLLNPDFIGILVPLMLSENMDVSYFAAGILSHLCSDTELDWGGLDRSCFLDLLGKAVTGWKFPETEMVAYRSFNPFFTLLQASQAVQVQLWAVWAILHVCSRNPKRYVRMLTEEGILQMLERLKVPSNTLPLVASLASDIIRLSSSQA